ncbi:MAG: hypothetical protein H6Q33_505 [Deltaproteobacteria bacterium]|nr:hypothetical protein [Deltaproteobacteria bacterium]
MAVVISFQEFARARRRQEERACAARCVEILESSLCLALFRLDTAPPEDRPLYAKRVRQLSELLEYAGQTL